MRRPFLAFICLFVGLTAPLRSQEVAPPSSTVQPDTARLIEELGLQEAPTALRDQAGWRRPRVIIVPESAGYDLASWRAVAPDVELIVARDLSAAVAAAPRADAVIGFCSAELFAQGPNIRWVQMLSAGVEHCVSIPAIAERNILLTNMQRVFGPVMAEHVLALTLTLARGLPAYLRHQAQGRWARPGGDDSPALALQGKTMLIAGLGGIGTEVARRAHALGMRIVATRASGRSAPDFVSHVGPPSELVTLAREADVVVNALPLTPATADTFNATIFAAMKPRALFINVGRGGTVVTDALVQALQEQRLGGAGLDVTDPEPLPADHPLWRSPNVIITPHVAALSDLGQRNVWQLARENLRRYVAGGRMLAVVDVRRGY